MEQAILALINKLDPNSIILVLVLYGTWHFAKMTVAKIDVHGQQLNDSAKSIAKDMTELRVDIAKIAARVELHEERLDRLEHKS